METLEGGGVRAAKFEHGTVRGGPWGSYRVMLSPIRQTSNGHFATEYEDSVIFKRLHYEVPSIIFSISCQSIPRYSETSRVPNELLEATG